MSSIDSRFPLAVPTVAPPKSEFAALRARLDHTLLRDRLRLRRELDQLAARPEPDAPALARWRVRADAACARYNSRVAGGPEVKIDESLPIAAGAGGIVGPIR